MNNKYNNGENMHNDNIAGRFTDSNGSSRVILEYNGGELNMKPGARYVMGNKPNKPKSRTRKLGNVGPKSNGFAGVAVLAAIIAIGGIVIAYLTLKY